MNNTLNRRNESQVARFGWCSAPPRSSTSGGDRELGVAEEEDEEGEGRVPSSWIALLACSLLRPDRRRNGWRRIRRRGGCFEFRCWAVPRLLFY